MPPENVPPMAPGRSEGDVTAMSSRTWRGCMEISLKPEPSIVTMTRFLILRSLKSSDRGRGRFFYRLIIRCTERLCTPTDQSERAFKLFQIG